MNIDSILNLVKLYVTRTKSNASQLRKMSSKKYFLKIKFGQTFKIIIGMITNKKLSQE
jgi:hypothetical protein